MLRLGAMTTFLLLGFAPPTLAGVAEGQYAVAAHHYANARWELAVEEFRQFLEDHPNHDRADAVFFYLGESLVQLARYQDARDRFTEYLARCPHGKHERQSRFRVGEVLYLDDQYEKASSHLKRFVEQHPDDALCEYALPYLGEIALSMEEPLEAQRFFEQGLSQFPAGSLAQQCRFGLARALEKQGDADGAIRFYEFLGGSDQRTGISDDALLHLGILLYHQGHFGDAVAAFKRKRQRFPGGELAPHAAYWLGVSQSAAGHFEAAADTLAAAVTRFPEHELAPAMVFAAGEARREMQDWAAADRLYQRLLDEYPDSSWADDGLRARVQVAWAKADYVQVRELAGQFAEQHPSSSLLPLVQQTAARACLKQGEYARAIALLEPSLDAVLERDIEPGDGTPLQSPQTSLATEQEEQENVVAAARYYLALALLGAKRYPDALQHLDVLTQVQGPPELVAGVRVARASTLLELDRYEDAVASLQQYLSMRPDGPEAEKCRAQLAMTCARLGRWDEVQQAFSQMQQQHKDREHYLASLEYLAEKAYDEGRRDLAERMFRELAQDGNPDKYVVQGMSGLAWLDWTGEGENAASAEQFERLLKRFPESPLAAEAAMMRGRALEKADKPNGALAMYQLVRDRYPGSPHASSAILAAARIHDSLEQDREAEPLLRDWLDRHPSSDQRPGALYQLAWVLVDLGRDAAADDVFQQIYEGCRSSRYWSDATYRLAERAARSDDFERADSLAQEIIESAQEPQMVAYALYLRGQLAAVAERWGAVIEPLQRLLDEYPASAQSLPAQYWLAEAYYRQRQYDTAGKLFAELHEKTLERDDAWVAMIPLRRAQVMAHHRQWDESYKIATQISIRFPEFSRQHEVDYLIGRYYASRARFEQAREAYLRVVQSETGRATETAAVAQWMIGETYFMQKQYNQAIKAYHRVEAVHDFPRWKAAALLQAGKCHEMVGRWHDAVALYDEVVNTYKETSFAAKAAKRLRVAQQRAGLMQTR